MIKWLKEAQHCIAHLMMWNDCIIVTRFDKITGKLRLSAYCKTCGKSHEIASRQTRRFGAANRREE